MKYTLQLFIACLFMGTFLGSSQEKSVSKADEEFEDFAFIDAREAYLKVAQKGFRSVDLLQKLGDSYYFTGDYKNAAQWYGALYEYSETMEAEYLYRFALSLKSSEQYDASDRIMEELFKLKDQDFRAELYVNERNYLAEIEQQSGRFELKVTNFNSELSDFAPAMYRGNLVIASNRKKSGVSNRVHDWNEQPFLDLYVVNSASEMEADDAERMSKAINTKYHESTAVFSKDGNTMYFTRNNYHEGEYKKDAEGINRLKLFRGIQTEEGWEVTELPFNSDEYSVAHPALSSDGKTLYFASDMPGGKGMSDLYMVTIDGESFGTPQSLGDHINTEGRETFPFMSSEDQLYFASDGHLGLGGLDIFVAEMTEEGFGEVYNLGRPLNGPMDDFSFIINGTTGIGYFASNREGGVGDDDIYSFFRKKEPITRCEQIIKGQVRDDESDLPIVDAMVMLINDDGDKVEQQRSDEMGNFNFSLDCKSAYSVRATKDDYSTAEKSFVTSNELGRILKRSLFMKKGAKDLGVTAVAPGMDLFKILGLNPIYFDLDTYTIRPDAEIELQKIIVVMQSYPSIEIDVRSHTDSRANDAYNMKLSDQRAQATINYLVEKGGIDRNRLTGKGYGESQLVNECENGTPCSKEAHQRNRRSEFIIKE